MSKIFGIDLGTTYSCIAYIDENGKPVVLKNAEGDLTTPSVVHFESPTDIHVGSMAKENAKLYPDQVVSFVKRSMGVEGFSLPINGVDYKPEDVSSYILKKLVNDAKDTLAMEGKLEEGEEIKDVVITCPAYFGDAERRATEAAGRIAGLNVLSIINEPTAAAINYGSTATDREKTVLVYDLGGGTFDVTMINIKPDAIRVIVTGGDKNLGGKDWDDRILQYLQEQFQAETGSSDNIMDDPETFQELSLQAERAKKLLSAKEKAPVPVNYEGEHVRVNLTRAQFDEMTKDLLQRSIDLTKDLFKEAEKKGFKQSDVSEILLVGGSSKMPQVISRVKEEFGIDVKMFDPDEAVAKGAAIYANHKKEFDDKLEKIIEQIAEKTGQSKEELKEKVENGQVNIEEAAEKANVSTGAPKGKFFLGGAQKIVNVSSRSFGIISYTENKVEVIFNLILKNDELPADHTETFYPYRDNQRSVALRVYETLTSEPTVADLSMGKEIGVAELELAPNTPRSTEIGITFRLNDEGILQIHAKEMLSGKTVDASFETKDAMTEQEMSDAIRRNSSADVD